MCFDILNHVSVAHECDRQMHRQTGLPIAMVRSNVCPFVCLFMPYSSQMNSSFHQTLLMCSIGPGNNWLNFGSYLHLYRHTVLFWWIFQHYEIGVLYAVCILNVMGCNVDCTRAIYGSELTYYPV